MIDYRKFTQEIDKEVLAVQNEYALREHFRDGALEGLRLARVIAIQCNRAANTERGPIKRFYCTNEQSRGYESYGPAQMEEDSEGEYVLFVDYLAALKQAAGLTMQSANDLPSPTNPPQAALPGKPAIA
jgi:hypothetical protein